MWCRPFPWIQVAWIPPYISLTLPYITIKCPTSESFDQDSDLKFQSYLSIALAEPDQPPDQWVSASLARRMH
jgi:hypothetical protein